MLKYPSSTLSKRNGFTLLEITIVLIVLALLAGGIVVGSTMISSSKVVKQIAQVQQVAQGVKLFREKYQALPGDMVKARADRFGFPAGTGADGESDGDGLIESCLSGVGPLASARLGCENLALWIQLSQSKFIEDNITLQNGAHMNDYPGAIASDDIPLYLPKAHIGTGYLYAWDSGNKNNIMIMGLNEFTGSNSDMEPTKALTPAQAKAIDDKIDDGISNNGIVTVRHHQDGSGNLANYDASKPCTDGGNRYHVASDEIKCSLNLRLEELN